VHLKLPNLTQILIFCKWTSHKCCIHIITFLLLLAYNICTYMTCTYKTSHIQKYYNVCSPPTGFRNTGYPKTCKSYFMYRYMYFLYEHTLYVDNFLLNIQKLEIVRFLWVGNIHCNIFGYGKFYKCMSCMYKCYRQVAIRTL
jgi:hypothetical protein